MSEESYCWITISNKPIGLVRNEPVVQAKINVSKITEQKIATLILKAKKQLDA